MAEETFVVGDRVEMPGVPFVVTVLEVGTCDGDCCTEPTFRFSDPESKEDDWAHVNEFRKTT